MRLFIKIGLILLGIMYSSNTYGQSINADSLYAVWSNIEVDEVERIKSFYTRFTKFEQILQQEYFRWGQDVDEAIELANKYNKSEYLDFFMLLKGGNLAFFEKDYELGCEYFENGLKLAEEQKDHYMILVSVPHIISADCPSLTINKLIEILNRIEPLLEEQFALFDFTKALLIKDNPEESDSYCMLLESSLEKSIQEEEFNLSFAAFSDMVSFDCMNFSWNQIDTLLLPIREKVETQERLVPLLRVMYHDLAIMLFWEKSRLPDALKAAQKVKLYSERLNIYDVKYCQSLSDIGKIHNEIGNYDEAEKYFLDALINAKKIEDLNNIGGSYIDLSVLYLNKNKEHLAKSYIDSAIHIMRDVKECEPCYSVARIRRAGISNLGNRHEEALDELLQVKSDYIDDALSSDDIGIFYLELSKTYNGLKQYNKAISAANTGLRVEQNRLSTESEFYNILYRSKEKTGAYKASLRNYKTYVTLQDSLSVLRNSEEVTRLELENQFAQQRLADSLHVAQQKLEADLIFQAQLNKQKTTKNLLIAIGIGILLLAFGLYYRLKFIKKTQKVLQKKNEIIEAEKEKAQASERAKHQFLANMSHEIRTPMNAIKGMTDILIRRNPKTDQKEYLDGIKQSSDSLLVIINDILDISKIEAGKIELEHLPFSIHDVVNNVHTIMRFKAEEKGLQLQMNLPAQALNIKGDATRLRQILINLIGNAIKFTDKGLVTTSVNSETQANQILLHFTISDTGIGIDKSRIDSVFKSFEQEYSDTSRKFGGTGLGLSISKKLVNIQQGEIWVESKKGKGSQFHFTIPYEINETTIEKNDIESTVNLTTKALKGVDILLVEDNQFNAVVAKDELEDAIEAVHVDVAENGAIGFEKLKSSKYDIILMDVQMPVMNGYEATKAIRELDHEKAKIPIIAMTANVLKEEVELCYQAGMNDFIGKPFDTLELIQKIHNQLNT